MKRSLIGLVAMVMVAGCATIHDYETLINGWVGHSEDELVQVWGPPTSVYQSASTRYLTYARSNACGERSCVCNTHFEFANGRITSSRWDGDGCPSVYQKSLLAPAGGR
jgi:hypothetical protein